MVANELSHSVSLIDLSVAAEDFAQTYSAAQADDDSPYAAETTYSVNRDGKRDANVGVRHIRLGAIPKPGAAERGELHFYNARLSHANWFSCHSCHTDGHSNGGLADTLADGSDGAPKRILSLLGVAETGPWAWKGNKPSLKNQVHQSIRSTMQGREPPDAAVADLVEFLKTLQPPPPFQRTVSKHDAAIVERGRRLFESLNCSSCHNGRTLTSKESYDIGFTDELGTKEFNPPSLRGVGHRYGLFHSKQAKDVEEVITRFRHQLSQALSSEQQQALIRYLKSL